MKTSALLAALMASAAFLPNQASADPSKTIIFSMQKSGGPATTCPFTPSGRVTDHTFGDFENLEVVVRDLPPNTGFDLFSIQVPGKPFGLAWYIGDIQTDSAPGLLQRYRLLFMPRSCCSWISRSGRL
jgi:hypothetical protein